jgi:hypothetical protein
MKKLKHGFASVGVQTPSRFSLCLLGETLDEA